MTNKKLGVIKQKNDFIIYLEQSYLLKEEFIANVSFLKFRRYM